MLIQAIKVKYCLSRGFILDKNCICEMNEAILMRSYPTKGNKKKEEVVSLILPTMGKSARASSCGVQVQQGGRFDHFISPCPEP